MENRIIILFFVFAALSMLYRAFSAFFLAVRKRRNYKYSPFLWAVFFFAASCPLMLSERLFSLKLYTGYEGGRRIEIYRRLLDGGVKRIGELDMSGTALGIVFAVCAVYVVIRAVKFAASAYMAFASYSNTLHFLTKYSKECRDTRLLGIFEAARHKTGLRRKVTLRVMKDHVSLSPCTCGIIFPTVFIESDALARYGEKKLELAMVHEMVHIKHGDSLMKLLMLASDALQVAKNRKKVKTAMCEDAEMLCDRTVIGIMGEDAVKDYMSLIIDAAEENITTVKRRQPDLYERKYIKSSMSDSAAMIMKRYENIKSPEKKKCAGALRVLAAGIAVNVIAFSLLGVSNSANMGIDIDSELLRDALCLYFGLDDPEKLDESMINSVYSIEFSRAEYAGGQRAAEKEYALCITLNGGFIGGDEDEDEEFLDPHDGFCYIGPRGAYSDIDEVNVNDIPLFHGLRTLIFEDRLTPSDERVLFSDSYAVIQK